MPINQIFGKTFNVIEKSLDIHAKRHELITSNIANLDTPDYRPGEINFKDALDNATNDKTIGMRRTNPHHFDRINGYSIDEDVDMDQASNGVNWVDIDKEMTKLAENNLMYRTGVEVLLRKLAGLRYVITEGGR